MSFSIRDVVEGGFCVGCGACGALRADIALQRSRFGIFEPSLAGVAETSIDLADQVCPFSDTTPDEDAVAHRVFQGEDGTRDRRIGQFTQLAAGHVVDPVQRETSSSGGLTNWIIGQLLETGRVDGVIHVFADGTDSSENMFSYAISRSREDLQGRGKSKYRATHMAAILQNVRGDGRRYVFVGVPCFVTAARHLASVDALYGEQLVYFVGLVCGHMKTTRFGESLAWQIGVPPDQLALVDFRLKAPDRPSSDYSFAALSKDGEWKSAPTRSLYGADWGHAFFQPKACDFCDDIFAEAADVALGDAWLPAFEKDWLGTNVLVSRRREIDTLLDEGVARGEIHLEALPAHVIAQSQGGNFRHRRDGLAVRLHDARKAGLPTPRKRVAAGKPVNYLRRRLIRLRQASAARSHTAFLKALQANDFSVFRRDMEPLTQSMARVYLMMKWLSPGAWRARLRSVVSRRR